MGEDLRQVYDEVAKCNRCGFCQAHCPIFDITKDERNVARGHNAHVRSLIEGELEISEDFKDPLFECLLCKACVANCFPAVRTERNVVAGRAEYVRRVGQPRTMRFLFHRLLPDPVRMGRFVRLAAVGKNTGITRLARALGILKWFGKDFDRVEGLVERLPTRFFRERARTLRLDGGAGRTVAYFVGCGFNFVLPDVAEATVEVLVKGGARVRVVDNVCCGLPAYGYGDLEAARALARKNMDALEQVDAEVILTDCGSCSAFLKEYPELFEESPEERDRASRLASRVKGFSEYLAEDGCPSPRGHGFRGKVTYHDPCHLSRYQGVVGQPRQVLRGLPGVEYVEMPEADRCCGAAGSYNVLHYEQSMVVLDRKMENLRKTEAGVLATECPGCLIQLRYGVRRASLPVRVAHVSELVREACS
ncbi:MAG: (Fe-S)-binding protein [Deltaproteobacteria bacterium]|nr:(Fe-S)-binding protein [Deltaproteobacteria bacterium]